MDLSKYLAVLLVLFVDSGESGGHGGEHHDHVKLHMPEFIHHDHHTKVITIHHHHHKPKKEHHHHHHHHHHPKPHIPKHHYNHHHHKTTLKTTTVSKGHKQLGHGHSGHHGLHTHHGHHGSHGHGHYGHGQSNHDSPTFNHDLPSISHDPSHVSFEDDYKSFTPSIPVNTPHIPQVHGVVHTVKQVKVFDSLPGSIKGNSGGSGTGYEVTEEGVEGDEDVFTSVNSIPQTYQGTYGFVRSAAPQTDSYPGVAVPSSVQLNHDPFAASAGPSAFSNLENFSSDAQSDSFPSSLPAQSTTNAHALPEFEAEHINPEQISGFDDPGNSFIGNGVGGTALFSSEAKDDTPVTFSREAGVQQSFNTGGIETVVY